MVLTCSSKTSCTASNSFSYLFVTIVSYIVLPVLDARSPGVVSVAPARIHTYLAENSSNVSSSWPPLLRTAHELKGALARTEGMV
jgi:hypothetical protein